MTTRYRWAWFALACVVSAALLWTARFQYSVCDTDGCVVVDRWTGTVGFREAQVPGVSDPGGSVVVQGSPKRTRPAPQVVRFREAGGRRRVEPARR